MNKGIGVGMQGYMALLLFICSLVLLNCNDQGRKKQTPIESNAPVGTEKWYEGGTLQNANALEWQKSDSLNKLATSGDFVGAIWLKKGFKRNVQNSIRNMNDAKLLAIELTTCLDEATREFNNELENSKYYSDQNISNMAILCMVNLGWIEQ